MTEIIGRDIEQATLNNLYHSGKSEFIAIYGRRRIGKTFLIREMFKDRFAFYHTGLSPFELNATSHCHWRVTVQETPLLLPAGWMHSIY